MTRIAIVRKNADFTEGRGPMLFDGAFSDVEKAKQYINSKPSGIYGAKPPEGMTLADWCMARAEPDRPGGYARRIDGGWGGYDIEEIELDAKLAGLAPDMPTDD